MVRKSAVCSIVIVCVCFALCNDGLSWNEKVTHPDLAYYAASVSVLSSSRGDYLRKIGFNKGLAEELQWGETNKMILDWFLAGADLEDASTTLFPLFGTTRSLNHFHNPLKPWTQAGLDDWYFNHYTGQSALLWAQDGTNQQNVVEGDWSWQKIRLIFYYALTASNAVDRQAFFAGTFRGLGHQMHLIQDMAVPDHVRNDAHPEDAIFKSNPFTGSAFFESWAKWQYLLVNSLAASPVMPSVAFDISSNGLAPITQLWDTDYYAGTNPSASLAQGLAEYTNANFFSNDTIFAAERYSAGDRHYFPYPRRASTDLQSYIAGTKPAEIIMGEDGAQEQAVWISKIGDGESIAHFVRPSILTNAVYALSGEGDLYYSTFYRDDECHKDYISKLVPRAVGYSAALLDYFFRGQIEITVPDSGMYAKIDNPNLISDGSTDGFTEIRLLAKNITPNDEQMSEGSIELIVKYRVAKSDPFVSGLGPSPLNDVFSYIVVPEANNIRTIPSDHSVELVFNLNPALPLWATDVYIQVVYKGTLGMEDDAIAVGFKDISEPTPVGFFNHMDRICLNGTWYDAGSYAAFVARGVNTWDIYVHNVSNAYIKISPQDKPSDASPQDYTFHVPQIKFGVRYRTFILTDDKYNVSFYGTTVNADPFDTQHQQINRLTQADTPSIKRQTDYVTDPSICADNGIRELTCILDRNPTFVHTRGINLWSEYTQNWGPYPITSECQLDE